MTPHPPRVTVLRDSAATRGPVCGLRTTNEGASASWDRTLTGNTSRAWWSGDHKRDPGMILGSVDKSGPAVRGLETRAQRNKRRHDLYVGLGVTPRFRFGVPATGSGKVQPAEAGTPTKTDTNFIGCPDHGYDLQPASGLWLRGLVSSDQIRHPHLLPEPRFTRVPARHSSNLPSSGTVVRPPVFVRDRFAT